MADGSREFYTDPKQMDNSTFSVEDPSHDHLKQCQEDGCNRETVKIRRKNSVFGENSETRGGDERASNASSGQNAAEISESSEDRKKRCIDRYDSSESSDSGVALLSPAESGCSGSDITEPSSPRSPETPSGAERMPPWVSEAPPRRHVPLPAAPARRPPPPPPPLHRRITEFFNHKMKPHNGLKRDAAAAAVAPTNDPKRKCLPTKNGVTNDLEKYISYLSQTLSPRVVLDICKQEAESKPGTTSDPNKSGDPNKGSNVNGLVDYSKPKDNKDKVHSFNGFVDLKKQPALSKKEKASSTQNGLAVKKHNHEFNKKIPDPSANGITNVSKKPKVDTLKRKMTVNSNDLVGMRVAPIKPDSTQVNGVVSSTTKLDSKMNGVTYGSNNISLSPIAPKLAPAKREPAKKTTPAAKRTNRKSSACIANSKNLTWSKANNLKQVELQKQNCVNSIQGSPIKNVNSDVNSSKVHIQNGVRQVSMTMNGVNGTLNNLNMPVSSLQNCHQIGLQQQCNGTVPSTNLASFVAMPQNVMLTTLRIPQNGIPTQAVNQHGNMAFTRQNVNVSSPTKLNGQFVFPLMQNLNGTVVQIPNLMAKVPNFVLPQTSQLTSQRQDAIQTQHLQTQQAAQILINGTLLKLANTMASAYTTVNKTGPSTSQALPGQQVNKSMTVGITVPPKPNYTVNYSHPVLVPQPGFIVTSVPNINVKETWSNTYAMSTTHNTSCSNPIVHHPRPIVTNFSTQAMHTSSIPIAPVKPPDNPIQGVEPPSSTVKEPETPIGSKTPKCDIPWLTKTINNNTMTLNSKISRPFAQVCNLAQKLPEFPLLDKECDKELSTTEKQETLRLEKTSEEIRRVEEVARREETIFTQITVLKDVSSNVQNTVIEACSSATNETSSDSGLGTDKSIDSPSDSQASKEFDEDSSLSLSISVCSGEVSSSQKSPILKQPKTLRFPPKNLNKSSDKRTSSTDTSGTVTLCLWEDCKQEFESDTDLLEHLQTVHVESQAGQENYTCQWTKCKVKGKPSCSRLWLERHALSHGGNKPFKCIVDGCGRRFSTQILLERHVNNHFNEQSPNTSSGKKSTDSAPKLMRRNGKKLRYRRQPWSARMFDFFDSGVMESLTWRLVRCTRWRLGGGSPFSEPAGRHTLTLHATVAATRYNGGAKEALVTYHPANVLEDEWVPEKDVKKVKRVEMASLPAETKVHLYEQFCKSYDRSPPASPSPAPAAPAPRLLPARHSTSSRLLNNLLGKKEADDVPLPPPSEQKTEVSGAKKRKMGRKHGGNAFWPCGR